MEPPAPARRSRRHIGIIAGIVVLVTAGLIAVTVHVWGHRPGAFRGTDFAQRIEAPDGVRLSARVVLPRTDSSRTGPAPLIVIPGGWNQTAAKYDLLARTLASRGYVVVAYAQRGQKDSGGTIDFAGPTTQSDVSTVIDWALAHTPSDAKRIGLLGTSYGAGVSLLAAARDPRIRAVVATSTWASLAASFTQNDTVSTRSLAELFAGARLDPQFTRIRSELADDPQSLPATFAVLSPARSPMHYVAQLNRNDPAIMLANGYEDQVFAPRQLISFYNALTTPKRLQLAAGDHGQPEGRALLGYPDVTMNDAFEWFDHYLLGKTTAVQSQAPVQLQDVRTAVWHGYRSWPGGAGDSTFELPRPGSSTIGTIPSAWSAAVIAGVDSPATSGTGEQYPLVRAVLRQLPAQHSVDWSGPDLSAALPITGAGALHLSVGSSAPTATFFTYLYDVAPDGVGTLLSFTPYTATGLTPGASKTVDVGLQPITWTLPAHDHVEVVIDTVDGRYHSAEAAGTAVRFSSTAADPATVTIPVS